MEWNAKFRKKSISNKKKIQINSKNGMEYMEWNAKFRKKSISNIKKIQINSKNGMEYMEWNAKFQKKMKYSQYKIIKKWNKIHGIECEISKKKYFQYKKNSNKFKKWNGIHGMEWEISKKKYSQYKIIKKWKNGLECMEWNAKFQKKVFPI